MPSRSRVRSTYTESSTVVRYAARSLYGDSEANPTTVPTPSTATIAANAPERAASQASWSASERGTRSNVLVAVVTSRL